MCFDSNFCRSVLRKDSPNVGRSFFVCGSREGRRCEFFRWADELDQYSNLRIREPLTASDVQRETAQVDPDLQLSAWAGLKQGTDEWHRLRSCRVTASNFGSVHNNHNKYCSPSRVYAQHGLVYAKPCCWTSSFDLCYGPRVSIRVQ